MEKFNKIFGYFTWEGLYSSMVEKLPNGSVVVELGAFHGRSLYYFIMESVKQRKTFKIYSVDTFTFVPDIISYSELKKSFWDNLIGFTDKFTLIEGNTWESAIMFQDNSVDFLFIDAGHDYDSAIRDITCWLPKMKKGSVMAGHDYGNGFEGVERAVDEVFGASVNKDHISRQCWLVNL